MTDSIAFLLSDVSRLIRRRFDVAARSIGVTRAQWRVLTALNRNEGLNQGALAELIEVEAITLCRMIDRLAEAGLVERRRAPGDRRAWHLYLTDKSRPLIDQLFVLGTDTTEHALAGLAGAERAALSDTLSRMRENLQTPFTQEAAHG